MKISPASVISPPYAYPVKVNGRYVMDPSPIPKFDNPKMNMMPALQLFGAGREKRIYAVPPFTTWKVSISTITRSPFSSGMSHAPSADRPTAILMKWCWMTPETACLSAPIPIIAANRARQKTNESTVTFGQ